MTDLADFLLARIAEDEHETRWLGPCDCHVEGFPLQHGLRCAERVLAECDAKRRIMELHESWPVLVEQQPEFAAPAAGLNDMTFRMTQQIAWLTQEEYRKRFGEEPPTTPMLRALALPYADHPGYREEWRP